MFNIVVHNVGGHLTATGRALVSAENTAAKIAGFLCLASIIQPLFHFIRTEIVCRPIFTQFPWADCVTIPK
jgi:hypothetical protein